MSISCSKVFVGLICLILQWRWLFVYCWNIRNMHTGFLLFSNKSYCLFLHLPREKIGCDTSTGLSAAQRPASIQPHHNTSILWRDTLPTFCAQRSRLSLRCGPLSSDDNRADVNTNIFVHKHSQRTDRLQGSFDPASPKACPAHCLLSTHRIKLHLCVCVIKALWSGVIGTHQSNGCVPQTEGYSSQWCTIWDLS